MLKKKQIRASSSDSCSTGLRCALSSDVAFGDKVLDCRVVGEVDLTMDASVDHRMIMMMMHVDVCAKEQKRARREAAADSMMLNDPSAKGAFQGDVWRFLEGRRPVDVDEHQLEAALRRFGSARSAPMKPWFSALTWSFPRLIAPERRSFHAAFDVAKKLEKQCDVVNAKSVQANGMMLRTRLKEFSPAV